MSEGATTAFVIITFVAVFPAFWIFITAGIAELGGWKRLERVFPDDPNAREIERFRLRSANLGHPVFGVSYSHILTFTACETGMRIRVPKLFGLFSKPLFLPWNSFRTEPYQWLFWQACKISWGSDRRDTMIVYRSLAEDLARASGGAFGSPEQGR